MQDEDVLEQSVEVLFDPFPKQIEFIEACLSGKYRVVLFGGAIRGGKTFAGLGTLILLCKIYPGSIWAVVRDSLPTLKRTTIKSFAKVAPTGFVTNYNQETQTVSFSNGSQIIFFPENFDTDKELNRWKGLEVSGFLLEECNELQQASFFKAIERSGSYIPKRGLKKPPPLIMMTCNPSNNWVKELLYDPWEAGTLPEGWTYIPSKITDNPYIMSDTAYVESLKMMPTYQYEVFVEGNWNIQLKIGGEYFKCFELDIHVTEKEDYNPDLPIHCSWDENVNPYLPCGLFQIDIVQPVAGGQFLKPYYNIIFFDEIAAKSPTNTVEKVCLEIQRKFPGHKAGVFIYGDATSKKEDTKLEKGWNFFTLILSGLKQYSPRSMVMSSNPAVVMRQNFLNTIFEKEFGQIRFRIHRRCKTAINDFVLLKEDENGGKQKKIVKDPKTGVSYQEHGHFADLLEYFICSRFSEQFAAFQAGGAVSSMRFGKNAPSKNSY